MIRGDSADASLYRRAADLVHARHIESDTDLEPLFETTPEDGEPDVLRRLRQIHEAGGWVLVESAIADLPADLRWLFESGAVTIEQLATIHRSLGVTSAADLAAAVQQRALGALPGLDADVEAAVAAALPALRTAIPRVPLGRATAAADLLLQRLRAVSGVTWALPAGSLRRGQDTVGDIEIVAATDHPADAIEAVLSLSEASQVRHRSQRRLYLVTDRTQVGVRLPAPSNAGATLLYLTGSSGHFEALMAHAAAAGWRLTADGLHQPGGTPVPAATEEVIYAALGLPSIPAEIRNGEEEVATAMRGELPELVERGDIRGDLHMHSTWSDGRDTVEAMVQGCRALGYQYMAITDHSPHSAASRSLTADGVMKQAEEIARLQERHPALTILHGCEVDILPDGRLDFPEKILERFDIVLASLHERAGHSREQLMKRYLSAMKHPLVTLITHPANRLVPTRPGYDLDYDHLFEVAVTTGTIVEIDGAPSPLHLVGALARRAVAAGATVAISSDCHRVELLARQMDLGILTARRGWVEARHVLNTRSLADVRAVIACKRAPR